MTNMKKILITMAVLTGMVAGAMVFSSFAAPNSNDNKERVQLNVNDPVFWEGEAKDADYYQKVYITVYQTVGQCNSFYAIDKQNNQYWVKENPRYDPDNCRGGRGDTCNRKYYITKGGTNYYFNM